MHIYLHINILLHIYIYYIYSYTIAASKLLRLELCIQEACPDCHIRLSCICLT